ncbi:hypothetical protein M3J09_011167 [Ascochyta lentis]
MQDSVLKGNVEVAPPTSSDDSTMRQHSRCWSCEMVHRSVWFTGNRCAIQGRVRSHVAEERGCSNHQFSSGRC